VPLMVLVWLVLAAKPKGAPDMLPDATCPLASLLARCVCTDSGGSLDLGVGVDCFHCLCTAFLDDGTPFAFACAFAFEVEDRLALRSAGLVADV